MVIGSNLVAVTKTSDIVPVSSKEFLHIHATIEYKFTLKHQPNIIRTYSQIIQQLLQVFCIQKQKIYPAYVSKQNSKCKKQVILLMIPNVERWHFIAWKKLSVLLRRIMPNNNGNFYCLNFHSFRKKILIHVKKYVKIFFFVMLQCFLKTLRYSLISNDNSEKSSTTKVGEHIASDFPVSTISSVKDKIKHDV